MWGGLVPENAYNTRELHRMLRAGAVGLKGFMSPSGMEDFPPVDQCAACPRACTHPGTAVHIGCMHGAGRARR